MNTVKHKKAARQLPWWAWLLTAALFLGLTVLEWRLCLAFPAVSTACRNAATALSRCLSALCGLLPFPVSEWLLVFLVLGWVTWLLLRLCKRRWALIGRGLCRLVCMGCAAVFLFVALYGDLGAGKTALIRGIARALGYEGNVTSPTFAIVNDYRAGGRTVLYHMDIYRLDADGLDDIGWEDYLAAGVPIAVEWAENAEELMPADAIRVHISGSGEEPRMISVNIP